MRIHVSQPELRAWVTQWPACPIPVDRLPFGLTFDFDTNGNLVDIISAIESQEFDGSALLSVVQDAERGIIGRRVN